jgi:hypothetical protein
MDKETYIHLKGNAPTNILYEHYRENFDASKHKPMLGQQEFYMFLQMWGVQTGADLNGIHANIMTHYDGLFNVNALKDEQGNVIKYV